MDKIYVKGNRDEIVRRFNQIYSITLRCPINDKGVKIFENNLKTSLKGYLNNDGDYVDVPSIDIFNVFVYTLSVCREDGISLSKLYVIMGCIQSFKNLKTVTFKFIDDADVDEVYQDLVDDKVYTNDERIERLGLIYDVTLIEMNLSDMFSQEVIDLFNKFMMHNELMHNSYLKREFYLNFDYDGFTSFISMFIANNSVMLDSMDTYIVDYFRMFPVFIANQKPVIRIVTNYKRI